MGEVIDDGHTLDPIFRQVQILAMPPHKWMKTESTGSCALPTSFKTRQATKWCHCTWKCKSTAWEHLAGRLMIASPLFALHARKCCWMLAIGDLLSVCKLFGLELVRQSPSSHGHLTALLDCLSLDPLFISVTPWVRPHRNEAAKKR